MQRCNATLRLSGDLNNTIRKEGLSPAEIVILRVIHGGEDAVVDIQPTMMDKVPHAQERSRLVNIYGGKVVEHCFPGAFAKLPVTLKEIAVAGVEEDLPEEEEDEPVVNGAPPRGPSLEPVEELAEDDKAIIAMIQEAKTKGELHALADEHEVEREGMPKDLPDMKLHMIRSLFPMYRM